MRKFVLKHVRKATRKFGMFHRTKFTVALWEYVALMEIRARAGKPS